MKKLISIFALSIFVLGCSDNKPNSDCDSTKFDCTPKQNIENSVAEDTSTKKVSDSIIEDGDVIQTANTANGYVKPDGIKMTGCGANDYCADPDLSLTFMYSVDPNNKDNFKLLSFSLPFGAQPFHIDSIELNTKSAGVCAIENINPNGYDVIESGLYIELKNCPSDQIRDIILTIDNKNYII